MKLHKTQGMRL